MRSTRVWSFSLPPKMVQELERIAQEEHCTKSELIREALRCYVEAHHWKHLQREMAARAQHLGITTEEDIERLIDEVRR